MFRKGGEQMHQHLRRMGIVHCDKLRPAFHEPGDGGDVAGKPGKLGDD